MSWNKVNRLNETLPQKKYLLLYSIFFFFSFFVIFLVSVLVFFILFFVFFRVVFYFLFYLFYFCMEMAFWCESNISFFFIKKSFDPSLCDVGKPNKNVCTWSEVTEPIWEQWYTKTKKSKRKKKETLKKIGRAHVWTPVT